MNEYRKRRSVLMHHPKIAAVSLTLIGSIAMLPSGFAQAAEEMSQSQYTNTTTNYGYSPTSVPMQSRR
jgi:hypothetical protein